MDHPATFPPPSVPASGTAGSKPEAAPPVFRKPGLPERGEHPEVLKPHSDRIIAFLRKFPELAESI